MKINSKTALALLLAALTLSSTVLASCAEKNDEAAVTTNASEVVTEEGETTRHMPDIPEDTDFEGADFLFLTSGESDDNGADWITYDVWVEQADGDTVTDAVFDRNLKILEKLNINITETKSPNGQTILSMAQRSVAAQSDDYDAIMTGIGPGGTLAQSGYVYDLFQVPYMELSNEWWDQKGVEELAIGGKLYWATGDITVIDNDATWVLMFNKNLISNLNLESPYDLVWEDRWNFEIFHEMIVAGSADLDGNGAPRFNKDRFGFVTTTNSGEGLLFASGERITVLDSDGFPMDAINQDRLSQVVEFSGSFYADRFKTLTTFNAGVDTVQTRQVFEQDRGLFYGEVLQCVTRMRAAETNFGLIPWPKFDESQEEYYNMAHSTATKGVVIPVTQLDIETAGIVLEYMAGISMYTLTPAYYDIALTTKQLRDVESGEMLDIILASRVYDLGYVYDWGAMASSMFDLIRNGKTGVASNYAKHQKPFQRAMDKTIDAYLDNE